MGDRVFSPASDAMPSPTATRTVRRTTGTDTPGTELTMSPEFMTSFREQFENLPTKAKSQYFKLTAPDFNNTFNISKSDFELLNFFFANFNIDDAPTNGDNYAVLLLNVALLNHSCIPNAGRKRH